MLKQPRRKMPPLLLLTATAALGLMLAVPPALAQDSGPNDDNASTRPAQGSEQVIVTAPRYERVPGPTGSDIVIVSMSRAVRIGDLDLNTAWGRDTLRTRVRATAADICSQLLRVHTAGASGSPPCYADAVNRSIHRANPAVRDAYYTNDYF